MNLSPYIALIQLFINMSMLRGSNLGLKKDVYLSSFGCSLSA